MAATALTSSLVVRLIDQVTAPAQAVSRSLLGLEKATKGGPDIGARLAGAWERNNQALARARGGLVDAAAGFYALKGAIAAPIGSAIKFESALADIAKVSDFDDAGLAAYGKQLRHLAVTEIPLAVDQLAAMSAAAAQAGVPEDDLFDFTRTVAKAAVAWDMNAATAGEALAKIRTALRLSNDEVAAYADAINHVSDRTAASAQDMVDFTNRVAAQGEFFGFAKEQTLAFGAAMIAAGNAPEVAATSFRNMGRALTRGESATKRQSAAYRTLGLDAEKVAKAMQEDAVGSTMKVIEKLGQIPKHMQAALISDLFGDEARALSPLLNNMDLLQESLALTAEQQSYLNSVGREFEKRAATSEYKLRRFGSQLHDIALTVGASLLPALNSLLGPLGEVALKFSAFAEAHPELIRNVLLATGAVVGFKIAVAGMKFVGLLGRGGALSMLALGYNTIGKAAIAARSAIGGTIAMQTALSGGAAYSGMAKFVDGAKALVRVTPGLSLVGPAVTAIGGALATITAPVAAGIAAVAAAGFTIYKYWDRISSIFAGVGRAIGEQLAPAIEAVKPYFEWLKPIGNAIASGWEKATEALSAFGEWIGSFFAQEVLSEDQKAEWEQAGYDAATRMIEAIKSVFAGIVEWASGIGSRIGEAIGGKATAAINRVKGWFGGGDDAPANDNPAPAATSGHRKRGGPVWPGGSFLVGEEQPEVFTPKTGGTITPLGQGGGVTTVTIGDLHFHGIRDEQDFSRKVKGVIEEAIRETVRSVHADIGTR